MTKRVEHAGGTGELGAHVSALDPATKRVAFSPEEVRAAAKIATLQLIRQPQRAQPLNKQ